MKARPTSCRVRTTKIGAQVVSEGKLTLAYIANYGITAVSRKANADLLVAAWNAAREINADDPIRAAEMMPEIWKALGEALAFIEDEARQRSASGIRAYFNTADTLARRIQKIIDGATARE